MAYLTATNLMYALLGVMAVWVMASVMLRSRDPRSKIHMDDLLLEDGKISRTAVVTMLGLMLTTWLMVYLVASGKMTEGYMAIYVGAWIAPAALADRSIRYRAGQDIPMESRVYRPPGAVSRGARDGDVA